MPGFVSFETWSHVAWVGLELTLIAKGDLEILILLPSRVQCRDPRREHCTVNVPTTPAQICTKTTFRVLESLLAPLVCGHFHLDLSRHGCFIQMVSHLGVPMRRENSQQQLHRGVTADYRFHHVVLSVAAAWGPAQVSFEPPTCPVQPNSNNIHSLFTFSSPNYLLCVLLFYISLTSQRMLGREAG